MAFNKIDGVTNISKNINNWRNVVVFVCQKSRNVHNVPQKVVEEGGVVSDVAKNVPKSSSFSKHSPVSLYFETAVKPSHDRTIELKKAAAQLSRSNDTLRAHYLNNRNALKLVKDAQESQPQKSSKLTDLLAQNVSIAETIQQAPTKHSQSEDMNSNSYVDFKPQNQHKVYWQTRLPKKVQNSKSGKKLRPECPKRPVDDDHIPTIPSSQPERRQSKNIRVTESLKNLHMGKIQILK
ncbi:hypothetical protein KR067_002321 [Drosophila pandora]|nr:hypothetical protein KR067_002321 [Drosophila pandora]